MRLRSLAALAAVLLLVACQPPPDRLPQPPPADESPSPSQAAETSPAQTTPPSTTPPQRPVEVTVVARDLAVPWDIAFSDDGSVYVTERDSGRLLELVDGDVREVQRLAVDDAGEGGLLGLATRDGLLYAYLTTTADNRVVRFRPGEEPEPLLTGIPRAVNHNGGRIAFGPDGLLYVGTGDAGQELLAQDSQALAGKILRLDPDTRQVEVVSLGHRNVQGLAWTADGTLYASEFGPDRDDEINRITEGANYGWPHVTGRVDEARFTDPVLVRQPPDASWSGAAIPHDSAIPRWDGDLFVASLRGARLWRVPLPVGSGEPEQLLVGEYGRLRHVAQAPDGSLWVLTSNRDGRGRPAPGDDRILRLGPPS